MRSSWSLHGLLCGRSRFDSLVWPQILLSTSFLSIYIRIKRSTERERGGWNEPLWASGLFVRWLFSSSYRCKIRTSFLKKQQQLQLIRESVIKPQKMIWRDSRLCSNSIDPTPFAPFPLWWNIQIFTPKSGKTTRFLKALNSYDIYIESYLITRPTKFYPELRQK